MLNSNNQNKLMFIMKITTITETTLIMETTRTHISKTKQLVYKGNSKTSEITYLNLTLISITHMKYLMAIIALILLASLLTCLQLTYQ